MIVAWKYRKAMIDKFEQTTMQTLMIDAHTIRIYILRN